MYTSNDLYEEEILRNSFSLKLWWRYLIARRESPFKKRFIIYERAQGIAWELQALPCLFGFGVDVHVKLTDDAGRLSNWSSKFEKKLLVGFWLDDDNDVDLMLAHLEYLMDRRPGLAKKVDNLAGVWCEWAEMEIRHQNFKGALELLSPLEPYMNGY
ncbi:hypothetical protein NC651_026423 [Populus alba x Populus x berolinensis]|nr:hypothetical protein NC651_026423 [Populus alba x Populus x berolinensis]